jgi:hypothetical protein
MSEQIKVKKDIAKGPEKTDDHEDFVRLAPKKAEAEP